MAYAIRLPRFDGSNKADYRS